MNRKGLVVAVILLFIGVSVIPSTATMVEKEFSMLPSFYDGDILYVGGSGPNNYTKIQDAIDNSSDGDTVFVYDDSSPYYENVIVDKSINLIGENKDTTIIDSGGSGKVVFIYADRVNVSGFTIQKSGIDFPNAGIYISSNFNNISNNIITKNKFVGIKLHPSFNTIIYGNIIRDNQGNGIDIARGSGEGCDNNIIKNNIIINNTYSGIGLVELCNNNTIIGNTFEDHAYAGIDMWLPSNNIITGNEFVNNYFGIHLYESNNNYIFSNTIRDSISAGIHIMESSNSNKIYHNNLINNTQNAYDECDNTWDSGYWSGGNYWSDYTGDDFYHGPGQNELGRDWRGDTPYNIAGGSNQDKFAYYSKNSRSTERKNCGQIHIIVELQDMFLRSK